MNFCIFATLAACFISVTATHGALYTVRNVSFPPSDSSGVEDSLGRTFRNGTTAGTAFPTGSGVSAGPGIVAFGVFNRNDANLSSLNKNDLLAAFQMFGASMTFLTNGTLGNRGLFASTQGPVTVAGSVFDGNPIYLLAGNGSIFADSSEFLILRLDTSSFAASDDLIPTPTTVTITPANSTVLVGQLVANVQTANTDSSNTLGWQMVPEPSVAILLPLAGVIALRRRRQAL